MRVWLVGILVLLAGCLAGPAPSGGNETSGDAATPEAPLPPAAEDVRAAADADALAWNPGARLILIAVFEGDIPEFGTSPLADGHPWVDPFRSADDHQLADGRSPLWSFSYAVDDEISQAAMAACDLGQHAEAREGHVVLVDETGTIVSSYETRNDDEGSTTTGFLPDGLIGSAEAALAAESALRLPRSLATYSRTFLATEWFYEQPAWVFQLQSEEDSWVIGVDATTGKVLGDPSSPKC